MPTQKNVVTRHNSKLPPPNTNGKYPWNLECQFVQETWSTKTIAMDGDEYTADDDKAEAAESFQQEYTKAVSTWPTCTPPITLASLPEPPSGHH